MKQLKSFYNNFHLKNQKTQQIIQANNFTYFYLLQLIKRWVPNLQDKKVLDIGCGVGTLTLYLAGQGAKEILGIDIADRAITLAKYTQKHFSLPNLDFKCQELTLGKQNYDLVCCFEIIEHVADDLKFLQTINSQLKKDAWLILTTPSQENIFARHHYFQNFDRQVGHLRRYRRTQLESLFKQAGFKILEIKAQEGPVRTILFSTKLGWFIKFIKGPFVKIFHYFDDALAKFTGAADWQIVAKKI